MICTWMPVFVKIILPVEYRSRQH